MTDEQIEQEIHQIQEKIRKDELEIEQFEREEERLLEHEHHEPHNHKVKITIDNKDYEVNPGEHKVAALKELAGIPVTKELEEIIDGVLTLLADDATVEIHGCEVFLSQDKDALHVTVHYPAAKEPYKESCVCRTETVGILKSRALVAFGLVEGQESGQTFTYTLYHKKRPLENLAETLGQVAGEERYLELKLSQQITQG
jgi:hypothetical protein